jgi:hypothetical protein
LQKTPRFVWFACGAIFVLCTVGLAVWYFWPREDRQLVQVQQMAQKLFDPESKLSDEQRRAGWGELRAASESLSPEQQETLRNEMFNNFRRRGMERINRYFELPEGERRAYLDEQIRQMEAMRRRFEQSRGTRGEGRGGDAGRPGPGGPGGPGGQGAGTPEQERNWRRTMLDRTTPEERAKFAEYMEAINKRRQELGLEPIRRPGPGGGRGPR